MRGTVNDGSSRDMFSTLQTAERERGEEGGEARG